MNIKFKSDNSGFTKSQIEIIQRALNARGFSPGGVDGRLGPRTNSAIIVFKASLGLIARPYIGPVTWSLLTKGVEFSEFQPTFHADMPPWIKEGIAVMRMHEREDNKELSDWLKSDDGETLGDPSVLPWCGDFAKTAMRLGLPSEEYPGALGKNPYWALNWRLLGRQGNEWFGAPISITRDGGGHVGFAVGQNTKSIFVFGGNQNNRVSIAPIPRHRFTPAAWRWPLTYTKPPRPLPWMDSTATEIPTLS